MDNRRNEFGKLAEAYSKYRRDYPDKAYEIIFEFCPDRTSRVLDLGCGTGISTHHLAQFYNTVVGIDKEMEMLNIARAGGDTRTQFIEGTVESLPFPDSTFDFVTVASAYHWFDYDKAGAEIFRVLQQSGKLCVFWKDNWDNPKLYLPSFAEKNLRKYIPDIPRSNRGPISEEIFTRCGFRQTRLESFDYDAVYSPEEILGHIRSHSTYNLLTDEQKVNYMHDNEVDVEQQLVHGSFVFRTRMMLWLVEK